MTIRFTIHPPQEMPAAYREAFLELLRKQEQIDNPAMNKINACGWLCLVHDGDIPIGIGAIKHGTKSAFRKANTPSLADEFSCELGYLYVEPEGYRGLGIGKAICRFLLHANGVANVFATTSVGKDAGNMVTILQSLGFEKTGETYQGRKTHKTLGLFLKFHKK